MEILRVEHLTKTYFEVDETLHILKDINLSITKGKTIAITGESGSGKSTLLHILGTLDNPDSGKIFFNGKEINPKANNINKFRNKNLGFVFQFHYLLEDFTAEENVAVPMFILTKDFSKSIKKAGELLKKMNIYERRKHYPSQLSGGEQQRVAVARALINEPQLVLADEPTGNLDLKHSMELIDFILELNKKTEQTFVIVTHNKDIADKADEKYKLENGILIKI